MLLLFAYGINRFSYDVAQILLTHYQHTLQRLQIKGCSTVYFCGEGLSTDKQPRDTSPVKLHLVSARTDNIWYFHLSLGWSKWESWRRLHTWTASSEFGTYHLCEQRRFIRAVSPEPPLLAHTSSESRGTFRQKARSLASLNGWACAVKTCHNGMLEDTNSLDGAHMISAAAVLLNCYRTTFTILKFWSQEKCNIFFNKFRSY